MNNKTMRRPYAAPEAELICLAPGEEIASSDPWQPWFQQGDEWWALNKWGATPTGASITAGFTWLDVYDQKDKKWSNSELDP